MAKKKITKQSKTRLIVFGTASLLMIGYFLFSIVDYTFSISKLENQKKELEHELVSLKEDEQTLKLEIQKLQDPEYIARYARENYLYSKDGEYIIKIEDNKEKKEEKIQPLEDYRTYMIAGFAVSGILIFGFVLKKMVH